MGPFGVAYLASLEAYRPAEVRAAEGQAAS